MVKGRGNVLLRWYNGFIRRGFVPRLELLFRSARCGFEQRGKDL